jgi:hypothetical protein
MKCKHQNVQITEYILSKYTYTIIDGAMCGSCAGVGQLPRVFDVSCQDCDMQKTYRYGPGEFGPTSSPQWLYNYVEAVVCRNWKLQPAPERRKKA